MNFLFAIIALVVLFMVIRNPQFKKFLSDLMKTGPSLAPPTGTPPPTTTPPPGDGGQQPTTTGETPYPGTGAKEMNDEGSGTRHYASGKPDDVTHEWTSETSAQSYMIVIDITLTEIDHDDQIGFKFGGTHNGSGWFDCGYDFESGKACLGKEENHPSTDLCEVTGNSIGNLVNTPVKLAAVNFNKGEKLEMWSNLGSGWTKDVEGGPGVTGFRPSEDSDECTIRIDAAPGIEMRSAQVFELASSTPSPSTGGGDTQEEPAAEGDDEESGNLARVLTAQVARKKLFRAMYGRSWRRRREDGDFIPVNYKLRSLKYNKLGGL